MSSGRNAPCACGSGRKAKHCCERSGGALPGAVGQPPASPASKGWIWRAAAIVGIAALVAFGVGWVYEVQTGAAAGGLVLLIAAFGGALLRPPPPRPNTGDPAALNFGNPSN